MEIGYIILKDSSIIQKFKSDLKYAIHKYAHKNNRITKIIFNADNGGIMSFDKYLRDSKVHFWKLPIEILKNGPSFIAFDMDSTLIEQEGIDECARIFNKYDEVKKITDLAMKGKYDFKESLIKRVELLKGLEIENIKKIKFKVTPYAKEVFETAKVFKTKTAIISGGFSICAEKLISDLKPDFYFLNDFEVNRYGELTGRVLDPVIDAIRKSDCFNKIVKENMLDPNRTVVVGDGANDIIMMNTASFAIGYRPKSIVRQSVPAVIEEKDFEILLALWNITS